EQITASTNTSLSEQGIRLVSSERPLMRALGYALLASATNLTERRMDELAADTDLATPLAVLEWLRDSGKAEMADILETELWDRLKQVDQPLDLLSEGDLQAGGERSLLEILPVFLPREDIRDLYSGVALDSNQNYGARMTALMNLRYSISNNEYTAFIQNLEEASTNDPAWTASAQRLITVIKKISGQPADQPRMLSSDLELIVASHYPMQMEDLALYVEYVVGQEWSTIQSGCYERIVQHLQQAAHQPMTDAQVKALQRIQNRLDAVEIIQQTR
ncbi:MAG: hypothetical protein V2A34_06990, partial [Lentisphaerota bacterium]